MIKSIVLFIEEISSILLFVCPVLIYYLVKNKSLKGFMRYVGLYKPKKDAFSRSIKPILCGYLFTIFVFAVLYFVAGRMESIPLKKEYNSYSTGAFIIMVIFLGLRSGLCEEVFFRGWVSNNVIKKIGFKKGNVVQAIIFALPHILTFYGKPALESTLLVCNAFVIGYALGYIVYKEEGNITTAVMWHAVINMIAFPITLFLFR